MGRSLLTFYVAPIEQKKGGAALLHVKGGLIGLIDWGRNDQRVTLLDCGAFFYMF